MLASSYSRGIWPQQALANRSHLFCACCNDSGGTLAGARKRLHQLRRSGVHLRKSARSSRPDLVRCSLGLYDEPCLKLASAHLAVAHARCANVRPATGPPSSRQRGVAHREHTSSLNSALSPHGQTLGECFCCRAFCAASTPC